MNFAESLGERINEIRNSPSPGAYVRRRIGEQAETLSLAGQTQAQVEAVMESLTKLVTLLYQVDTDGGYANVDRRTWKILIPVAWGEGGWKKWGLRHREAQHLRRILLTRAMTRNALFDYNQIGRSWHLNLRAYPTLEKATGYLKQYPVELPEWRNEIEVAQHARAARVRAGRTAR